MRGRSLTGTSRTGDSTRGGFGRPVSFSHCRASLRGGLLALIVWSLPAAGATASADAASGRGEMLRVATFNTSLNRPAAGQLQRDLTSAVDARARAVASIIRTVRPDILLLNEFDYDADGISLRIFAEHYLAATAPGSPAPLTFVQHFAGPVNTGVLTSFDLNRDGRAGAGGEDAYGYGDFPGQYGMVVFSRLPIEQADIRTFQKLLWRDMPGASWPDDPRTAEPDDWYSPAQKNELRLSSKSHWDIPIRLPTGRTLHFLVSHPTPPSFDGPEDRNGHRNHDEIRFWIDYLQPTASAWIRDDSGRRGGLPAGASFVIAGDLNSDPVDGGGRTQAIRALLNSPRLNATASTGARVPSSEGAREATAQQGGANLRHRAPPDQDTADFSDGARGAGNLRVDYVLPSRDLTVCASGVFWPQRASSDHARLVVAGRPVSDHHLVWVDIAPSGDCPARP
jgi:hypothetical protein